MRNFTQILAGGLLAVAFAATGPATAARAAEALKPPVERWSWTGIFGSFDRASAQRGFQVYSQVCAACHSLKQLHYRDLAGLGYGEKEIAAFAANYEVTDGPNADGEMFTRPAKASDPFVRPFPNEQAAAAANGGAAPPDLSLIVKSRAHGHGNIGVNFLRWMSARGTASGADYLYHLMTGYLEPEQVAGWLAEQGQTGTFELPEGKHFNKWFPGHAISMAAPLSDGAVEYQDGTVASQAQMARDVATFLAWAAEPELETRKEMGLKVIMFLIILLGVAVAAKRRLWAGVKH